MPAVPNGPPSLPRARLGGLGPSARGWGTPSKTFEPSVLQAFLRHSCWEENPGRACWFAEKKLAQKSWNQH